MFVLDLWMHNAAPHGRNVSTQPTAAGVRVWAIDGDEALVGHVDDYAQRTLDIASQIPEGEIGSAVLSACTLAREPRHDRLLELVLRQRSALDNLLAGCLQAVESLR